MSDRVRFLEAIKQEVYKYDALVEFASTPGGALTYTKDLFAVPIVVTTNNDTAL